jgi:ribosomal protein uS3
LSFFWLFPHNRSSIECWTWFSWNNQTNIGESYQYEFKNQQANNPSITDGVFYAELNEFFQRELAEEGYSGVEVRVTPTVTDIIIRATHTQEVLGEQGRRIRELTSLIQKRFKFPENSVSLYAAKVQNRGLSAVAQCESLRYKLLNGLAVRRACYGVLRFIMESGAKGCEVVVSGKLRAARAKSMKFTVRRILSMIRQKLILLTGRLHDSLWSARQGLY